MPELSIVVPCFNEARTLRLCVERLRQTVGARYACEILLVDDGSTDGTPALVEALAREDASVRGIRHARNRGKGAALRTGFRQARGAFVAVQDADLEYDPQDLIGLVEILKQGQADVVFGSRFLSGGPHRVLYFWHSLVNGFLTLLSNMFTDLNLSDIETGYKVFRRDVLEQLALEEDGFGIEPELVAKVAALRVRIYEAGISYHGRTYAEGKKIGVRDGVWALYCILRYNAHRAPWPMQFAAYLFVGGLAAAVNLAVFAGLIAAGWAVGPAATAAFVAAALVNYALCILVIFQHKIRWSAGTEILMFLLVASAVGVFDVTTTRGLVQIGWSPVAAKLAAIAIGLALNFAGRRLLVFPEVSPGPWKPQQRVS
jgi:glycosyltransferase involved in cell wall biosynthesis